MEAKWTPVLFIPLKRTASIVCPIQLMNAGMKIRLEMLKKVGQKRRKKILRLFFTKEKKF